VESTEAIPARSPRESDRGATTNRSTHSGRPYRPPEFVDQIEEKFGPAMEKSRPPTQTREVEKTEQTASVPGSRKGTSSGLTQFFARFFPRTENGIRGSKKGTDHSVPNPQSRKRPKCIFSGQSGLSPFLKGPTNLVRVNPARRRWNRRMAIPARRPRDLTEGHSLARSTYSARPRKPAKSQKGTGQTASVLWFAKRDKFRLTRFFPLS